MIISRKLFLIAIIDLGLGATFNTSAYDVVNLKEEVQLISEFAKNPDNHVYVKYNNYGINLGSWLENKIYHTYMTNNSTIVELTNIIKQGNTDQLVNMIENELCWTKIKRQIFVIMIISIVTTRLFYEAMDCLFYPNRQYWSPPSKPLPVGIFD